MERAECILRTFPSEPVAMVGFLCFCYDDLADVSRLIFIPMNSMERISKTKLNCCSVAMAFVQSF